MTAIRGGICGPDPTEVGGAYLNEIETDRSAFWYALGAQNGVLSGFTYAGVPGVMALDVLPGAALASERDAAGNTQARGYFLWSDATVRVTFAPASVAARNDALVVTFVDIEDGAVGTGGLSVGPQIVAIPGTSGVTTALTGAEVTAYLGRGGWVRLANVPILPGATQIATGTIALNAIQMRGWNALTLTAETGFTYANAIYRIAPDGLVTLSVAITRTGAPITANSLGNITNVNAVSALPTALRPLVGHRFINFDVASDYTFRGVITVGGTFILTHFVTPLAALATGDTMNVIASYYI